METIWQFLINTPWWVYVLFIFLIKIGFQASKSRVVSLKKLFIIPAVFTFMSVHTLLTAVKPDYFAISSWSLAVLVGILLGYWQVYRYNVQVDKKQWLIRLQGTWSTLIVILIIFGTKYYFSYALAVDPQRASQTAFEFSMLAVSGACTGLFIGRLICYLYRMKTNIHIDLTAS